MMRLMHAALVAEIVLATRLGAACDQWAASAALRLGKLSARIRGQK